MQITLWDHLKVTDSGTLVELDWEGLIQLFQVRSARPGGKFEQRGFSPGVYDPLVRKDVNCKQVTLVCLDIDDMCEAVDDFRAKYRHILAPSWTQGRFRLILPLGESVAPEAYKHWYKKESPSWVDRSDQPLGFYFLPHIEYDGQVQYSDGPLFELPRTNNVVDILSAATARKALAPASSVQVNEGSRNNTLARYVGKWAAQFRDVEMVRGAAHALNARWDDPLPEHEVNALVDNSGVKWVEQEEVRDQTVEDIIKFAAIESNPTVLFDNINVLAKLKESELFKVYAVAKQLKCVSELKKQIRKAKAEDGGVGVLAWVASEVARREWEFDWTRGCIKNDDGLTMNDFARELWVYADSKAINYSLTNIREAIVAWGKREGTAQRREAIEALTYDQSDCELEAWLKCIVAPDQELPFEDIVKVVKQWMWQVKRSLLGLEREYHLMVHLFGKQGDGKSVAIRKFLEPLQGLSMTQFSWDYIADERQVHTLYKYPVHLLDDAEKPKREIVNALKGAITGEVFVNQRQLHTHEYLTFKPRANFFSVANHSIANIVKDRTGMRRYAEIISKSTEGHYDFLNSFDYHKLWRSIDPHSPAPYPQSDRAALVAAQEELTEVGPVAWFLEECTEACEEGMTAGELYPAAKAFWSTRYDYTPIGNSKKFAFALRDEQVPFENRRSRERYYLLKLKMNVEETKE